MQFPIQKLSIQFNTQREGDMSLINPIFLSFQEKSIISKRYHKEKVDLAICEEIGRVSL